MNHMNRCLAIGCTEMTPRELAFCRRHWGVLSRETRDKVWKTYNKNVNAVEVEDNWNAWAGIIEDAKQEIKSKRGIA